MPNAPAVPFPDGFDAKPAPYGVSFTGSGAGAAQKSVAGRVGDVLYAIQGNVLAGREVIDQCEDALRTVHAAAPFPPIPADLGETIEVDVPLRYAFGEE